MKPRSPSTRAFTLVEIMVVIGILAIVLAMAMPSFIRSLQGEPLRKAMNDIVEACRRARADAILQGVPMEIVIRAADGEILTAPVPLKGNDARRHSGEPDPEQGRPAPPPAFHAQLNSEVAVTLLYVNLKDRMEEDETRVRFYPNGTSDEFTMIIRLGGGTRKISLECVTGLPTVEVIK
jgi:prepilin-type N-terminal cleavage/methylation domain-containing protein